MFHRTINQKINLGENIFLEILGILLGEKLCKSLEKSTELMVTAAFSDSRPVKCSK